MAVKFVAKMMILFALIHFCAWSQARIDLTEGTLFLLGGADLRYQWIGMGEPSHTLEFNADVGGGYFILDRLAVGLTVPVKWHIAGYSGGRFGLKLFSTYFFDINSVIFPYLGGSITGQYSMQKREFELLAGIDTGVLVSLSESVALDFGLRPEIFFKLYATQKWAITIPAGFFGVRAVF